MWRLTCWSAVILGGLATPTVAADPQSYEADVRPFVRKYCYDCHREKRQKAGIRLDTFEALMQTSSGRRPTVVPGNPEQSRLIQSITGKGHSMPPPNWDQPTAAEIATIRAWVVAGANNDAK